MRPKSPPHWPCLFAVCGRHHGIRVSVCFAPWEQRAPFFVAQPHTPRKSPFEALPVFQSRCVYSLPQEDQPSENYQLSHKHREANNELTIFRVPCHRVNQPPCLVNPSNRPAVEYDKYEPNSIASSFYTDDLSRCHHLESSTLSSVTEENRMTNRVHFASYAPTKAYHFLKVRERIVLV